MPVMLWLKVPLLLLALVSHQAALVIPRTPRRDETTRAAHKGTPTALVDRTVAAVIPAVRVFVGGVLLVETLATAAAALLAQPTPIAITPAFLAGVLLTAGGALLRKRCFRALGPAFTYELSLSPAHTLVTHGPYAYVRHPSYTGAAAVHAGVTLLAGPGSWWWATVAPTRAGRAVALVWIVRSAYVLLVVARAGKEDEMLRKAFGAEWETYRTRVPYRYVPGVL